MKLKTGLVALTGLIGGVVGGLFGFGDNSAQAAAAPPATGPLRKDYYTSGTWGRVRESLEQGPHTESLSPEIRDLIGTADLENNLAETVELSYKLVPAAELEALDEYWLETMLSRGNPRNIAHYLSIRASLEFSSLPSADVLIDRWVWQVNYGGGKGGGKGGSKGNNGFGNGDQDAPGNSGSNNNAENASGSKGNGGGNSGNASGGNGGGNAKGNNGFGNGDQNAPGNSGPNNNAENGSGSKGGTKT